jgi:hypothetical protein
MTTTISEIEWVMICSLAAGAMWLAAVYIGVM